MIDGTENPWDFEDDASIAKRLWDVYAEAAGGKAYDGKPLPTWQELGEDRQRCWIAVAAESRRMYK